MSHAAFVHVGQSSPEVVEQARRLAAGQTSTRAEHDGQVRARNKVADHAHAVPGQREDLPYRGYGIVAQRTQVGQTAQGPRPRSLLGQVHNLNHDVAPVGVQRASGSQAARTVAPHRLPDGQAGGHQFITDLSGEPNILGVPGGTGLVCA